jgi:hypothetical protein
MKVKGILIDQLTSCIENVNSKHGYKLIYNRYPERKGNYLHFTIRSEKSGIPGARTSHSGRNMVSASWHAHGYLFDEILNLNEDAIIKVGNNHTIDQNGGNWIDRNIGSLMNPVKFSQTSIL